MSQDGSVKEMLTPDHSNFKRGFVLVGLATLLGLFLSVQVISQSEEATQTEEVASPTVSLTEALQEDLATTTSVSRPVASTSTTQRTQATSTFVEASTTTTAPVTTTTAVTTTSTTVVGSSSTESVPVDGGVAVKVFNGAGFSGVASLATGILGSAGYQTSTPGDTQRFDTTQVLYTPGFEGDAETIAGLLNAGGANVAELDGQINPESFVAGQDIVVIIGRDEDLPR